MTKTIDKRFRTQRSYEDFKNWCNENGKDVGYGKNENAKQQSKEKKANEGGGTT
jgi:hypothetical protein